MVDHFRIRFETKKKKGEGKNVSFDSEGGWLKINTGFPLDSNQSSMFLLQTYFPNKIYFYTSIQTIQTPSSLSRDFLWKNARLCLQFPWSSLKLSLDVKRDDRIMRSDWKFANFFFNLWRKTSLIKFDWIYQWWEFIKII